jgi:PspAA-like protein
MKRKTNSKRKRQITASKLKTRRKAGPKKVARKGTMKKRPAAKAKSATPASVRKIVRIMGQGQFTVDGKTLKKLNELDNSIVELVSQERSDDSEFRRKLAELSEMVVKNSKPLDPKAIIQSDIILPSTDLSIDEAKRLFRGEGVIPEI